MQEIKEKIKKINEEVERIKKYDEYLENFIQNIKNEEEENAKVNRRSEEK